MASQGEGINAGLRSVKWRHLVMRVTFIHRRDLAMCSLFFFFIDALKVLQKQTSLGPKIRCFTPQ